MNLTPSKIENGEIVKYYKPSELIGIFNNFLSRQNENAQVVFLRGVYLQKQNQGNWAYCYDILRDEDSQEEITLQITPQQRGNLKNGNLVMVGGVLGRSVSNKGFIQLVLKVSRIEIVQEKAIDEAEIKRMELRQAKATAGFKNVDGILEQILFSDKRPRVALIFAQTSITMSDFNAGINAAKSAIDFMEYRVNFSNSSELIKTLQNVDENWFDVMALIRGGGGGIEKLDDISVLETLINLKTPIIGAIGHVEEKLFIKQLVDKAAPTPNGLGQYFSEMVETVSEKKSKSRAVLTEQIKKQFKDQLEAGQKQNKELQERLTALTKQQEEATKKHNEQVQALTKAQEDSTKKHTEQVQAAQKQNKELQDKLKELTEAQKDATKKHTEQMDAAQKQNQTLQGQLKALNENQVKLQEQHRTQQEELTKSISRMQEANTQLQKNLENITTQNAQSLKELSSAQSKAKELEHQLENIKGSNIWKYIAIIAIVAAVLLLILR